jgi:predicted kinase
VSVPVKIIEWQPGIEIPLHELDAEMFDVPAVGAPYWRGSVAMRVREVEDAEPVRVHLDRDVEREHLVLAGLPDGCTVDCGRDSSTGRWHATVERGGAVIASAFGGDCDQVVRQAVGDAAARP